MTTKKAAASAGKPRAKAAKKKSGKNREKLTPRQNALLDGILQGKSTHRAALDAGYSPNTAKDPGELLSSDKMRAALAGLLAPIEVIAQRINEGLDAIETEVFCNVMGSKLKGTEEVKLTHVDKVSWSERRHYAALAVKLKGLDPGIKVEHEGDVTQRVIVEFVDVAALQEP